MIRCSEEVIVVDGERTIWFKKCKSALLTITNDIQEMPDLWQIEAKWHSWLVPHNESLLITFIPEGENRTRIQLKGCADVSIDWILLTLGYGLSLHRKVIIKFKNALYKI